VTVSFALGWWLAPLLVTVAAFAHAIVTIRRQPAAGDLLGPFNVIAALVHLIIAKVISLSAWLAYFIWRVFVG